MNLVENLSPLQADALREVCNICCGHAATALSRLMGDIQVMTQIPQARRMDLADLPGVLDPAEVWVWTRLEIEGEVSGMMALVLARSDATAMVTLLCGGTPQALENELSCSALCEATNIAASASMNALSSFTRLRVTPGVPIYGSGTAARLLSDLQAGRQPQGSAVVLTTTLEVRPARFQGKIFLLPDEGSLGALLTSLGNPP